MELTVELSPRQLEAFRAWCDDETEIILYGGGVGGGKSYLGCFMIMLLALSKPGTQYGIARNTKESIRNTTLVSFYEVSKKYKLDELWTFKSEKWTIDFKNGSRIFLIDLRFRPQDPMYNYLGGYLLTRAFVDEVTECSSDSVQAYRTRCNRWFNKEWGLKAKMFMTCNPSKGWVNDDYYKPFVDGKLPPHKKFITASLTDNPYLSADYQSMLENLEDGAIKDRTLHGKWDVDAPPDQLIADEWLEQCRSNEKIGDDGPYYGVDVARMGDDRSTLAKIRGNTLYYLYRFPPKIDTVSFANKINLEMVDDNVKGQYVGIDVAGVGAGTVDGLRAVGIVAVALQSGHGALPCLATGTQKFANLRSQMWFLLAEDIRKGNFHFDSSIPEDTLRMLIDDLTAPTYFFHNGRVFNIEAKADIKKRLKRSTDYGDAVVYANWIRHMYPGVNGAVAKVKDRFLSMPRRSVWEVLGGW